MARFSWGKRRLPKVTHTREHRLIRLITTKIYSKDEVTGDPVPFIREGYYSWLPSEDGEPMQLDLFFPTLPVTNGPVAIEVQSEIHRGGWDSRKRHFFRTKEAFDRYTRNQARKKGLLKSYGIPLVEIWPETPLEEHDVRKAIEAAIGPEE